MASAADQTFIMAVVAAEAVRQNAKASAFATYAWTPANLAAYKTALTAADVAYTTAVNSARSTANLGVDVAGFGPVGGFIGTVAT